MRYFALTYVLVFLGLVVANALIGWVRNDFSIVDRCWWQGVALLSHYLAVIASTATWRSRAK